MLADSEMQNVLIIDANTDQLGRFDALIGGSVDLHFARSADQGEEILNGKNKPDLCVLDTEMLGKDATEMLATLQDRNVPTVVYGESSTGVDADEYLVLTQAETSPRDIANGILDGSLSSLINIHRMATRIVRCAERIETVYPGCA